MSVFAHGVGPQPHPLEQRAPPARRVPRRCAMREILQRLAHDRAGRQARIHRRIGILEDRLDAPAMRPHRAGLQLRHVLAAEQDIAGRGLDQLQHRLADRRLPAARLAHQPQRLAACDGEAHAVDRLHRADLALQQPAMNREVLHEALDLEDRCGAHGALARTRSTSQQATAWPGSASTTGGASMRQRSVAKPQRGGEGAAHDRPRQHRHQAGYLLQAACACRRRRPRYRARGIARIRPRV